MADLKTSQEDPVSDVSLQDMIRLALFGGGNARATIGQVGDAIASMIASEESNSAVRSQVQNPRMGRYLQSDGMFRDPMRLGLGTLSIGSSITITDDTKYNSWPDIERMSNGRLLMVYTKGDGHNADNTGKAVGKIGIETHAGVVSWGSEFTIYDDPSVGVNSYGVMRTATGRLIAGITTADYVGTPRNARANICYSDDDGLTWSGLSSVHSATGFAQESINCGAAVQLSNGDLVMPIEGTDSGSVANRTIKIIRSNDDGLTWGEPVVLIAYATFTRAHYETRLVVLPDESVLAIHRTEGGSFQSYLQSSTDGGATWGALYTGPIEASGAMTMRLLSTGSLILGARCQTAGANYGGFVAYVSRDFGVTWGSAIVVDSSMVAGSGIMQYASPIELRDGRVLFVYGVQPTGATTNSDIKTIIVTEATYLVRPASKHSVPIVAGAMRPSVSGGCAALAAVASAANQPDIVTLDFDATTQEYAQFSIAMPKSWNRGTVTFQALWSHPATTTNFGVVWDLQGVAVSDDDAIATAFGTAQTSTDTGGTTNDLYLSPESSAITIAGSPTSKDVVFFRLSRVTGNGSDTMAVDARLHGIVLYITTEASNDA